MSEADYQSAIVDVAHLYGYLVALFRKGRTKKGWVTPVGADGTGWLDLFLLNEQTGRIIFAEIKSATGKLSKGRWIIRKGRSVYLLGQEDWVRILKAAKQEVYIWIEDVNSLEEISDILREKDI